jgi:hypothetical protein
MSLQLPAFEKYHSNSWIRLHMPLQPSELIFCKKIYQIFIAYYVWDEILWLVHITIISVSVSPPPWPPLLTTSPRLPLLWWFLLSLDLAREALCRAVKLVRLSSWRPQLDGVLATPSRCRWCLHVALLCRLVRVDKALIAPHHP